MKDSSIIIGIDLATKTDLTAVPTYCPECLGTGKLKAMQLEIKNNGKSVRGEDAQVKCRKCNGTGVMVKFY